MVVAVICIVLIQDCVISAVNITVTIDQLDVDVVRGGFAVAQGNALLLVTVKQVGFVEQMGRVNIHQPVQVLVVMDTVLQFGLVVVVAVVVILDSIVITVVVNAVMDTLVFQHVDLLLIVMDSLVVIKEVLIGREGPAPAYVIPATQESRALAAQQGTLDIHFVEYQRDHNHVHQLFVLEGVQHFGMFQHVVVHVDVMLGIQDLHVTDVLLGLLIIHFALQQHFGIQLEELVHQLSVIIMV